MAAGVYPGVIEATRQHNIAFKHLPTYSKCSSAALPGERAMNKRPFFFLSTALISLALTTPALAQNQQEKSSIKVPVVLERVRWYKAPLQIQIVDPRPQVTDNRRALEQADSLTVKLKPLPTPPPNHYVVGDPGNEVVRRTAPAQQFSLPPANFARYSASQAPVAARLPAGQSIPVVNTPAAAAARVKTVVKAGLKRPADMLRLQEPARYTGDYTQAGGSSSNSSYVKTTTVGKLLSKNEHPLLTKLLPAAR
jgi:hypothetical protein